MPNDTEMNEGQEPLGASVLLNGRYLPPPEDKDGKLWVRAGALVQRSAEELYALWRKLEASPQWRENIVGVRQTDLNVYRWTMQSGDKTVEWDTEILADEPGKQTA